jgi:Domain of unknown function (DU1801)
LADSEARGTFEQIIEGCDPALAAIASALRERITAMHRDHVEIVWPRMRIASYGIGPKKMSEHYAYIAPQTKHVNLGFYHGAALKDSKGLLEGAGKNLRHIKIRSLSEVSKKELADLLKASLEERRRAAGQNP